MWEAMHTRVDMQSCVDARLAELEIVFQRHEMGRPVGISGPIGRPIYNGKIEGAWEMAVADQSLIHMPLNVRTKYLRVQGAYKIYYSTITEEREAWRALQQFDHAGSLSPSK